MKLNNNDDWSNELEEDIHECANKLVEDDMEEVSMFTQRITNKALNIIDRIEDDDIAIELTAFLGSALGGMSKGVLDLKLEVLELRRIIIGKEAGEQDSKLN